MFFPVFCRVIDYVFFMCFVSSVAFVDQGLVEAVGIITLDFEFPHVFERKNALFMNWTCTMIWKCTKKIATSASSM